MKKLICCFIVVLTVHACRTQTEQTNNFNLETVTFKAELLKDAHLAAGKLYRITDYPNAYIKPRPVDIWLPENYSESEKYAVLYMHDGQMLFDSTTTWNKQEWKVDEWATKLMNEGTTKPFIVVAIHNIPGIRWQDLYPQKALDYMDKSVRDTILETAKAKDFNLDFKSNDYLKFLVKDLKPYIDSNYSTLTDAANTFVAGSSMGGLMSMYAISEYPEIFGGAACFSTHWPGVMPSDNNPHPEAIFKYMETHLPKSGQHKLYFDYGNKTLDQHYPQYAPRVDEILAEKGYTDADAKNLFFEGTDHSEKSWNKRLELPLTFLLGKQ